jgi:chromosome segregation ATPase
LNSINDKIELLVVKAKELKQERDRLLNVVNDLEAQILNKNKEIDKLVKEKANAAQYVENLITQIESLDI